MRIHISSSVYSDEKWFPFLDAILLIVGTQRHSFASHNVGALLESSWLKTRNRSSSELIKRSCLASANDALRDSTHVIIDDTVKRGGSCDRSNNSTKIHPLDAIFFLSQPYQIIVENEEFDGAFLFWMAKALGFERFIHAYRAGYFIFRHAGGKDSIARSARIFCRGVWARNDGSYWREFDQWLGVVLDNDARFPGDQPNADIVKDAGEYAAFVHQLRRRSIESYIPIAKLYRFDSSPLFSEKVTALESLNAAQRNHFHMKRGFRYDRESQPTKANYMAAAEVSQQEKALFSDVADNRWSAIMLGFGKGLSSIYSVEKYRPTSKDPEFTCADDKVELELLIKTIYSRI